MPYKDKEQSRVYHNEYSKKWHLDNSERRNQDKRKRIREVRKEAVQALGGICVLCGYADMRALEIDHITPIRKSRQRGYVLTFLLSIVQGETKNLQVLCANCHAIKTYNENFIELAQNVE